MALTGSLLVVAGGGGGGAFGAGGGAGGLIYSASFSIESTSSFNIIVGDGGAGGVYPAGYGTSGNSSSFSTVNAIGGGGGGARTENGSTYPAQPGLEGGSGGGASFGNTGSPAAAGSGTAGQGNAGGVGTIYAVTSNLGSGGGGGAGGTGSDGNYDGGAGGPGAQYDITGTPTYYAGGGGGSTFFGTGGAGGVGGGGAGDNTNSTIAQAGTDGLGGGGGGGVSGEGGDGGSGVVIFSYSGSENLLAGQTGSVTQVSGNTIHTWDTVGAFSASWIGAQDGFATAVQASSIVASITADGNATVALSAIQAVASVEEVEAVIPVGFQRNAFQNDAFYTNFSQAISYADANAVSATTSIEVVTATGGTGATISLTAIQSTATAESVTASGVREAVTSIEAVSCVSSVPTTYARIVSDTTYVTPDASATFHLHFDNAGNPVEDYGESWYKLNSPQFVSASGNRFPSYDFNAFNGAIEKSPGTVLDSYNPFWIVAVVEFSGTADIQQYIFDTITSQDDLQDAGISLRVSAPSQNVVGRFNRASNFAEISSPLNDSFDGIRVIQFAVSGTTAYLKCGSGSTVTATGIQLRSGTLAYPTVGNRAYSYQSQFKDNIFEIYHTRTPFTEEGANLVLSNVEFASTRYAAYTSLQSVAAVSSLDSTTPTADASVGLDAISSSAYASPVEGIQLALLDPVTAIGSVDQVLGRVDVEALLDSVTATSEVSSFTATGEASTSLTPAVATSTVSVGVGADSRVELQAIESSASAFFCLAGGSVVGICPALTATSTAAELVPQADANTEIQETESSITLEDITPHIDVYTALVALAANSTLGTATPQGYASSALDPAVLTGGVQAFNAYGSAATALSALQSYSSAAALITLTRPGGDANPVTGRSSIGGVIANGYANTAIDAVTGIGSTGETPAFLAAEIDAVMAVNDVSVLFAKAFNPPRAPKVSDAVATVLPAGYGVRSRSGGVAVGKRSRGFAKDE